MRIVTGIVSLALIMLLLSCEQQEPVSDVEARLGLECFESHRASFPPGTQYEGIKAVAENRITIKIMNGVDVVTLECVLNPDGTIQTTGK